ncbi:hypothetical protein BLNAU_11276 [Blattamonas nauphoetae]|uniref:Uncharacterized protein n=1 Tax=Blattamonas nauphoetae TaxID=2049346 RepID=A0ABQ9XPQ9_9EUKA|nr:hypothetical protein BLNAU_11276 [Blattamonas nauphoetae]
MKIHSSSGVSASIDMISATNPVLSSTVMSYAFENLTFSSSDTSPIQTFSPSSHQRLLSSSLSNIHNPLYGTIVAPISSGLSSSISNSSLETCNTNQGDVFGKSFTGSQRLSYDSSMRSAVSIQSCTFKNMVSSDSGASLFFDKYTFALQIIQCTVTSSACTGQDTCGGFLFFYGDDSSTGSVLLTMSNLTSCRASGEAGSGGGVCILNSNSVTITSVTFTDCSAKSSGGAVSLQSISSALIMSNNNFMACSAGSGGGIRFDTITIQFSCRVCWFELCTCTDESLIGSNDVIIHNSSLGLFTTSSFVESYSMSSRPNVFCTDASLQNKTALSPIIPAPSLTVSQSGDKDDTCGINGSKCQTISYAVNTRMNNCPIRTCLVDYEGSKFEEETILVNTNNVVIAGQTSQDGSIPTLKGKSGVSEVTVVTSGTLDIANFNIEFSPSCTVFLVGTTTHSGAVTIQQCLLGYSQQTTVNAPRLVQLVKGSASIKDSTVRFVSPVETNFITAAAGTSLALTNVSFKNIELSGDSKYYHLISATSANIAITHCSFEEITTVHPTPTPTDHNSDGCSWTTGTIRLEQCSSSISSSHFANHSPSVFIIVGTDETHTASNTDPASTVTLTTCSFRDNTDDSAAGRKNMKIVGDGVVVTISSMQASTGTGSKDKCRGECDGTSAHPSLWIDSSEAGEGSTVTVDGSLLTSTLFVPTITNITADTPAAINGIKYTLTVNGEALMPCNLKLQLSTSKDGATLETHTFDLVCPTLTTCTASFDTADFSKQGDVSGSLVIFNADGTVGWTSDSSVGVDINWKDSPTSPGDNPSKTVDWTFIIIISAVGGTFLIIAFVVVFAVISRRNKLKKIEKTETGTDPNSETQSIRADSENTPVVTEDHPETQTIPQTNPTRSDSQNSSPASNHTQPRGLNIDVNSMISANTLSGSENPNESMNTMPLTPGSIVVTTRQMEAAIRDRPGKEFPPNLDRPNSVGDDHGSPNHDPIDKIEPLRPHSTPSKQKGSETPNTKRRLQKVTPSIPRAMKGLEPATPAVRVIPPTPQTSTAFKTPIRKVVMIESDENEMPSQAFEEQALDADNFDNTVSRPHRRTVKKAPKTGMTPATTTPRHKGSGTYTATSTPSLNQNALNTPVRTPKARKDSHHK